MAIVLHTVTLHWASPHFMLFTIWLLNKCIPSGSPLKVFGLELKIQVSHYEKYCPKWVSAEV